MTDSEGHLDTLSGLRGRMSLTAKLAALHRKLQQRHPSIARIAVALFDPGTRSLRTFVHSSEGKVPLAFYEAGLAEAPELQRLLESGRTRVIQDLSVYEAGTHAHTLALRQEGYRSSYTLPYYWNDRFEAFIFFNARSPGGLTPGVLDDLDLYGHLAGALALGELIPLRTLLAALRTATHMVHVRDPETGGHLERMAHFARLIARDLARSGKQAFDDDFIEHLFAFAPLHDVGKLGVPDEILMKGGRLTSGEFEIMKRHSQQGRTIVDTILANFGLEDLDNVDLLRHIAESHHEMLDGSGYPRGSHDEQVPIAARIVAVADVFDALTSHRPYKEPWSNQAAYAYLRHQAQWKLDQECVEALLHNREEVERIQAEFVH